MPAKVTLPSELLGAAFTVQQAYRIGIRESRLRSTDLARPFHGVRVAASSAPQNTLSRCLAYSSRMRPEEFFSHRTAAELWSAPLPPAEERTNLDVAVFSPQGNPRAQGVCGHRLTENAVTLRHRCGLRVTDPATTWLHLAALLSVPDLIAVGDYFIQRPVIQGADVRPYLELTELRDRVLRYSAPGKAHAMQAVKLLRYGAESRPESLLRYAIFVAGLPEPELNQEIYDSSGKLIGRFDLVYRIWRIVVEYDGDQHRTSTVQYDKDMTRLEQLARNNWAVVRVRKKALFSRPETATSQIGEALRASGWLPPQ